jgi:hypothetical protein
MINCFLCDCIWPWLGDTIVRIFWVHRPSMKGQGSWPAPGDRPPLIDWHHECQWGKGVLHCACAIQTILQSRGSGSRTSGSWRGMASASHHACRRPRQAYRMLRMVYRMLLYCIRRRSYIVCFRRCESTTLEPSVRHRIIPTVHYTSHATLSKNVRYRMRCRT